MFFLEILLPRSNQRAAKEIFAINPPTDLFMTDFRFIPLAFFFSSGTSMRSMSAL
jgi:hypothetical protein